MSFDYGVDENEIASGGGNFKNPEVGDHNAVLRSIIHCGKFREEFKGELKAEAPQVVAVFELKGSKNFEDDGTTPLTITKDFPLKKGDRAFMTKFVSTLDPTGTATGFDDLIGRACTVTISGSKELNEDKKPKYVNFKSMGGITTDPDVLEFMKSKGTFDLALAGAGHVPFNAITKEAIMELNPILHVADIIMKGSQYDGSEAQRIIEEIRVENADFAKRKAKEGKATESGTPDKPEQAQDNTPAPASDLDETEEF